MTIKLFFKIWKKTCQFIKKMFLVKKVIEIQLICLCWWTPIWAEKVYVEERSEPVRVIGIAVLYTFVWTRPYSLCLWKVFLSTSWTVKPWENNVIIMGRHTLKYACNFVFFSPFLNSCNHLSRRHWTVGKGWADFNLSGWAKDVFGFDIFNCGIFF